MSSSEGNATTRPLQRRKSKRFDRSGSVANVNGSAVIDEPDGGDAGDSGEPVDRELAVAYGQAALATPPETESGENSGPAVTEPTHEFGVAPQVSELEASPNAMHSAPSTASSDRAGVVDGAVRSRTLDELTSCGRCGHEVSTIHIEVDGNVLVMESCDNCDTRRWALAGESIELQQALDHVGEHAGRRR